MNEQILALSTKIATEPDRADLYYVRASALHRLDRNAEAIEDYNRALDLGLASAEFLNDRAVALWHTGQTAEALKGFTAAILTDPQFALAYINRGDLYASQGEHARAQADYRSVVEFLTEELASRPDDGPTLTLRGAAYNRAQQLDLALADLNRAAELSPESTKLFRHRGEVLSKRGRLTEAIADYDRVLAVDPHNPIVTTLRADAVRRNAPPAHPGPGG